MGLQAVHRISRRVIVGPVESAPIGLASALSHRPASGRLVDRNSVESRPDGYSDPSEERSPSAGSSPPWSIKPNPSHVPGGDFCAFSVRGMIVVVLLVGGWLGWVVRSTRIQREAVAAIERGAATFFTKGSSNYRTSPEGTSFRLIELGHRTGSLSFWESITSLT